MNMKTVLLVLVLVALGGCGGVETGRATDPALTPSPGSSLAVAGPTRTPGSAVVGYGNLRTPTPPAAGATVVFTTDSMVLVHVPAGTFSMGSAASDPDAFDNERPLHDVSLGAFWIDRTEVTNSMFARFLNQRGNRSEGGASWLDTQIARGISREGGMWAPVSGMGDHPVVGVTWYGARAYCNWAGRRLPTEAEWEKAARGTQGRTYPWGDEFDAWRLNFCDSNCELYWKDESYDDGHAGTAPVGSYRLGQSPYGAFDMAGNVWEWVFDWYGADYYGDSPLVDPIGPASGEYKVVRGSPWGTLRTFLRSAVRGGAPPDLADDEIGFRCVRSP